MKEKIIELKDKGFNDKEIIENIFLNYGSRYENDIIFKIKKDISKNFNLDINHIKLVGSAHSGIKVKEGTKEITSRKVPNDLDFAIIDPKFFAYILEEIRGKKLVKYIFRETFNLNLFYGKLHLMYVKESNPITTFCKSLDQKYNLDQGISICVYLSETFFIQGLEFFFKDIFSEYYKKYKTPIKTTARVMEFKEVKKLT